MGNAEPIFVDDGENANLRVLYPSKKIRRSISSFHPKLMIMRFPDRLRVVVGSGNLATGDWLFWANCFVTMDFPKRAKKRRVNRAKLNEGKKAHAKASVAKSKIRVEMEKRFQEELESHKKNIRNSGYGFEKYLRQYIWKILRGKHDLLVNFLKIDFYKFELEQNEAFLVGSLPGACNNLINYSNPEILKLGTKL